MDILPMVPLDVRNADLPFVDTLTLHKPRIGKRSVFTIGRRWESLFAERFVRLLTKTS